MSERQKNNLIAICSSTKGIGKTWFAGMLSEVLSKKKRKVLFFDADGGIENISCQHNLPKSDLYFKMLKNAITLNKAVTPYHKGKFDMIFANPQEKLLSSYPIGRAQILALDLKNFAQNYQYVLIDCSNRNAQFKNIFLNLADRIILMVEPNLTGSVDAYKELEHIKNVSNSAEVLIVINRALSYTEGEQVFKTLFNADTQFIGVKPKLLGVIKQDGRIRDCVINKTSLFERYPVSQTISEFENIAEFLMKGENDAL